MRAPTDYELPLIRRLFKIGSRTEDPRCLVVDPMKDGGMGSLRLGPSNGDRRFGWSIAEAIFNDADGTPVRVTLNVDSEGHLFEVDVWRVDFDALQRWPVEDEIQSVPQEPQTQSLL